MSVRGPRRRSPRPIEPARQARRSRVVTGTAAVVALLVFGSGSVALGAALGEPGAAHTSRTPAASVHTPVHTPASPSPSTPPPRAVPATPAAATPVRTCSVAEAAADPRLGTLEAQVLDADTGEVLYARKSSTPAPTASVMKIITAAAALASLGPDHQVATTVTEGPEPGSIVLVGGGDSTLSRLPSGQDPFYTGAPHLDTLADQVKAAWKKKHPDDPITTIYLDTSLYGGPAWLPEWDDYVERLRDQSSSLVTALQVDGDRADPTARVSPRSTTPIENAGDAFAALFPDDPKVVKASGAVEQGDRLGIVRSQPARVLLKQALEFSDNTIMEELARLVAIKEGAGNTFADENAGVLKALSKYGISTKGLHIADGSGLSENNAVPPSYLSHLMVEILDRGDGLGVIYDSLPIAGETGTLSAGFGRFSGESAVARGKVNAKTGSIEGAYTLAGVIHSSDGTPLTFAVYALGSELHDDSVHAIDNLVAAFYRCGANLSNR